ncbi:MAG TPA: hypothetical protein VHL11_01335 [Phototrophicaceae bacterium]|jgi:hypothetical protein|nr:hypothetical protein [Phototrophicaceae bacterium]
MAKSWRLATEREMQRKYCLPIEVVKDKSNRLWGDPSQPYPPVDFIADLRAGLPGRFTHLVITTIDEDSQSNTDRLNPLEKLGVNFLTIPPKEVAAMIEVISEIANSLPDPDPLPDQNEKKVFELLTDEVELKSFGLTPSKESISDLVYTLRQNCDLPEHKKEIYPIIHFNVFKTGMHFSMGYFNLSDLREKKYKFPYYYGLYPGLYLTRNGILELIELIKEHFKPLTLMQK